MKKRFANLDANESVFFARELEFIKSRTYDKVYPFLKQRQVIPVSFEADPAAETITYESYDGIGMAKIVRDYANDFPKVQLRGKEFTAKVRSLGDSYDYSVQEIRAAQRTGKPLQQRKANVAKQAIMELERDIAFYGSDIYNLTGWLNNTNIPDVALTNGDWLNVLTTADKIISDMNQLFQKVATQSLGREQANTMLMPNEYLLKLRSTPRSTTSDTTILEFFMMNNPEIDSVDYLNEMKASNSGGVLSKDIAIAYDRNPEKFTLEIPQEFEQFPPQPKGLTFEVYCHERIGGVLLYYPLSQAKTDDIGAP